MQSSQNIDITNSAKFELSHEDLLNLIEKLLKALNVDPDEINSILLTQGNRAMRAGYYSERNWYITISGWCKYKFDFTNVEHLRIFRELLKDTSVSYAPSKEQAVTFAEPTFFEKYPLLLTLAKSIGIGLLLTVVAVAIAAIVFSAMATGGASIAVPLFLGAAAWVVGGATTTAGIVAGFAILTAAAVVGFAMLTAAADAGFGILNAAAVATFTAIASVAHRGMQFVQSKYEASKVRERENYVIFDDQNDSSEESVDDTESEASIDISVINPPSQPTSTFSFMKILGSCCSFDSATEAKSVVTPDPNNSNVKSTASQTPSASFLFFKFPRPSLTFGNPIEALKNACSFKSGDGTCE